MDSEMNSNRDVVNHKLLLNERPPSVFLTEFVTRSGSRILETGNVKTSTEGEGNF